MSAGTNGGLRVASGGGVAAPAPGTTCEVLSFDNHRWWCDRDGLRVGGSRRVATRLYESELYFGDFPDVGRAVVKWVYDAGPSRAAATIWHTVHTLRAFLDFVAANGRSTFSAEIFAAWLGALASRGDDEASRRTWASYVLNFLESRPCRSLVSARALLSARKRYRKHFRGFGRRHDEVERYRPVSADEYIRLLNAVRREVEACRRLVDLEPVAFASAAQCERSGRPLLPFVLLAGILVAARSAEINALDVGDDRLIDGVRHLYLHAPNKSPALVPMPAALQEAWRIAKEWMDRALGPAEGGPLLRLMHTRMDRVVQFESIWIRDELRRFYQRYFRETNDDGVPVLYRESEGVRVPFDLSFTHYRSVAITEASRYELNPDRLRIFARHARVETTLKYYVRQTHQEWVENVSKALQPAAALLRIAMRGEIASGAEVDAAAAAGAFVRGGHCDAAVHGDHSCRRASHCPFCGRFRIHVHRRDVFVADYEHASEAAERAVAEGRKRDAEIWRNLAALNAAAIDRIDDYLAELDG